MLPTPHSLVLPGTDRVISRMGLGAMLLSLPGRPDRAIAKRVIQAAVEAGVTLIDSADTYAADQSEIGHNESLIAEALSEMGLDAGDGPIVVATKGGRTRHGGEWGHNAHPDHLVHAVHSSLQALRTERITLYQLHAPDPGVPLEDSVGAIARMRDEGKIEAVGLSNVTVPEIRRAQTIVPVTSVQNAQSIWDMGYRRSPVVEHCRQQGSLLMAYRPLGGAARAPQLASNQALTELGREFDATPHEMALAWLLHQGDNVVPIPGVSNPSRMTGNVKALSIELDSRALKRLRAAARTLPGHRGFIARASSKLARLAGR